jgi:tetratricopeptide (TPR) repeat protein
LESQSIEFQKFLRRCAVYRLPVLKEGIALLFAGKDCESFIEIAVRLSLMEKDSSSIDIRYWVTPLFREEIFEKLEDKDRINCNKIAVSYYQAILSKDYNPVSSAELIEHALLAGLPEAAVEEGGSRFLPYMRESLIYKEALVCGEHIRSCIPEPIKDEKYSKFIFELGTLYKDMGNVGKALEYSEMALSLCKEVYGEKSHEVATSLNNIGFALDVLGKPEKAIEYYKQAFSINREMLGPRDPEVAICLNNIGATWYALGKPKKAIKYYERALSIYKEAYEAVLPSVATTLNNKGLAWIKLGKPTKAMKNFEQAFSIIKEKYGMRHPRMGPTLNNIGTAWQDLGKPEKAIEYFEQALIVNKEVFGERHPDNAILLNNIGSAWYVLGDSVRAKDYIQQAYNLSRDLYGEEHPLTRNCKKWLDKVS